MIVNTITIEDKKLLSEIIRGLKQEKKTLPSKLFYDERGSQLFDEICELDEYYLTRTEMQIMNENIEEIVNHIGDKCVLVELGSGSSVKIRLLIAHLTELVAYVPIDISEEHLIQSAKNLKKDHPNINIMPVVADYTNFFDLPEINKNFNSIDAFYPGSTIGNFSPNEARKFLGRIAKICGKDSGLLIGVDLQKDESILNAAYNDSAGVTAEFNLNILNHLNNKFGANFKLNYFRHQAFYNRGKQRIEMHLISKEDQKIIIDENEISFKENESILTEYSYKYTLESLSNLLTGIYKVEKVWLDENQYFSVQFLRAI